PTPRPAETYRLSLHDALPICFFAGGEQPGALEHHVDLVFAPRQFGRITNGADGDSITVDHKLPLIRFDLAVEMAMHAVIAQKVRSEEHTSELQSRENLVCRLL